MKVVRIYTGSDGQSHFEDVELDLLDRGATGLMSDPQPAIAIQFRKIEGNYELPFHAAPRRQFVLNLTGTVEIEVGDGAKRLFGPGSIMLAEDTTGQGHTSRNTDGQTRTCVFVHLSD